MSADCHHIGILTENPERLMEFYTKNLGFKVLETKTAPQNLMEQIFGVSSSCRLTKLRLEGVILELITPESLAGKQRESLTTGYNHWGLGVGNREEFIHRLKEKNVPLLEFRRENQTVFFLKDPDGNLIEIYKA